MDFGELLELACVLDCLLLSYFATWSEEGCRGRHINKAFERERCPGLAGGVPRALSHFATQPRGPAGAKALHCAAANK